MTLLDDVSPRIMVTGAGGFVGQWMTTHLAATLPGANVLAVGGRAVGDPSLDVTRAADVSSLIERFRPTAIIHLAGVSTISRAQADRQAVWEVNVFGTMKLADAVMRHAPEARFIYASSGEVYGGSFNLKSEPVDESTILAPLNPYATTKAAADLLLGEMAAAGLNAVRLRPFNHTGPGQSEEFAVPAFAAQIAAIERGEREPVLRVGNLEAERDFLDVRDVVEAYRLAITTPGLTPGTVMNIASGKPRRLSELLDMLINLTKSPIRIERDLARMRASDIPITMGDANLARKVLGWQPSISLDLTIRDVLEFYRRGGIRN